MGGLSRYTGDSSPRPARSDATRSDHDADPSGSAPLSIDLQSLLASCLESLARATESTRSAAWAIQAGPAPFVVAAAYRDAASPAAPDAETLEALGPVWRGGRPVDLGEAGTAKSLVDFAEQNGFSCAAPLLDAEGDPVALLLLGGPNDPLGSVRPRTLAELDRSVASLRAPVMASAAQTRLSRLDTEVCRLDRLASLGELLSEVAHEIRNPLVSMKTFLHLLPEHRDDPEFQGPFREVVTQEVRRLERLLDTVLEHARPDTNTVDPSNSGEFSQVGPIIESMVRLLEQRASERRVRLSIEVEEPLPEVAIAEDRLRQIFLNLLLNALEAAPESSLVTLQARALVDPARVLIFVEDMGGGVPDHLQQRVFEPFFSSDKGRVGGLGLAISRKLVLEAGGAIRVESGKEGGARFVVEIPATQPAVSQATTSR